MHAIFIKAAAVLFCFFIPTASGFKGFVNPPLSWLVYSSFLPVFEALYKVAALRVDSSEIDDTSSTDFILDNVLDFECLDCELLLIADSVFSSHMLLSAVLEKEESDTPSKGWK